MNGHPGANRGRIRLSLIVILAALALGGASVGLAQQVFGRERPHAVSGLGTIVLITPAPRPALSGVGGMLFVATFDDGATRLLQLQLETACSG